MIDLWRPAIDSNVLHLNKKRPRPEVVKKGKVTNPPGGVQHEVEHLANEVTRLWRDFVASPPMEPYRKLTEHLDDDARSHAESVRLRFATILGVEESRIPWRPPPK